MKHIVITGGAGFVGSHMAEFFIQNGWQVTVIDNLSRARLMHNSSMNESYNWDYLRERFAGNIELIRGDVNDRALLRSVLPKCQAIIHTAGQTAVTRSIQSPEEDFINNVAATFTLLEESRLSGVQHKIIFCSSNKVYGERANGIPIRECDTCYEYCREYMMGVSEEFGIDLCKHSPYGCSKIAADIYCQEYARQYGMNIGVCRMSCIYGERQLGIEDQGWIAWFIIALLRGYPITVYGNGKQVRDVVHVSDVVRLFYDYLTSDIPSGVYNIGGGKKNAVSLIEVITLLEEVCGKKADVTYAPWRPSDQKIFYANITKAKRELGWEPSVPYKDGIKALVEWYQENSFFIEKYCCVK